MVKNFGMSIVQEISDERTGELGLYSSRNITFRKDHVTFSPVGVEIREVLGLISPAED